MGWTCAALGRTAMSRAETVSRDRYRVYLVRAEEFEAQMLRAAADGAWNSVGLLAVHSVISASDALTVRFSSKRWSGQDHEGVRGLITSIGLDGASAALRQLSNVLAHKNTVEYESRAFSRAEAIEISRASSRYLKWVHSQID